MKVVRDANIAPLPKRPQTTAANLFSFTDYLCDSEATRLHPKPLGHHASAGHHFLEFAHLLHHLLHLSETVQQVVEFGDAHAAAFGDADAAFGIEDLRVLAMLRGCDRQQ
jgi:hypothetical protein